MVRDLSLKSSLSFLHSVLILPRGQTRSARLLNREGRIVGRGESLTEIITSPSDEPWLRTGMCGPPPTGPPKTGGWREECRQSRGGRLEGGTWGWGANRAGFRGAGVSPCLLHQDSRQTPVHLCIQLHLQQAKQDIYLSDESWILIAVIGNIHLSPSTFT